MIFYDSETCGLHGVMVLLQYAEDDGPIHLHNVWLRPISETMQLIEWMMGQDVVGFNLTFDHFHLTKIYNMLRRLVLGRAPVDPDEETPFDHAPRLALLEKEARDGVCLKPRRACDLMLHARKGAYQSTMDRKSVWIRRIPIALAEPLVSELEQRIPLKDIYFARRKSKQRWRIVPIDGTKDFVHLELKFAASSALKAICADAFDRPADARLLFRDIELPRKLWPVEYGYAPFALAVGNARDWKGAWPDVLSHHVFHWEHDKLARDYAEADVIDTRLLYKHLGSPEPGDDDSELACLVGASRWRGYAVDVVGLAKARDEAVSLIEKAPKDHRAVRRWIEQAMTDTEKICAASEKNQKTVAEFKISTKKTVLEEIAKWHKECDTCQGRGVIKKRKKIRVMSDGSEEQEDPGYPCPDCCGEKFFKHPAAIRAQMVLDARKAVKEIELYDKIILAERFHASFKVIGTLSSRMSGSDGLNPQAINKSKNVRKHFKLAWPGYVLCGGDFKGFEVSLAEAIYSSFAKGESKFRRDLLSGKKVHALFGQFCYPEMSYDEIVASDGSANDRYTRAKSGFFALIYGGNEFTLTTRLGISIEAAEKAYKMFTQEYPEVGEARREIQGMFCSMRQRIPGGAVEWSEPAEYIETNLGFRRYFTLENQIVRALYELANNPPKEIRDCKIKVVRRERVQTAGGAAQSALFGAAFSIQGKNMRAAANHVIQGWGAGITKRVQRKIWDLQPSGIGEWLVQPMNIHDEIEAPCVPALAEQVKEVVEKTVEEFRPSVPLIGIGWKIGMEDWSSK